MKSNNSSSTCNSCNDVHRYWRWHRDQLDQQLTTSVRGLSARGQLLILGGKEEVARVVACCGSIAANRESARSACPIITQSTPEARPGRFRIYDYTVGQIKPLSPRPLTTLGQRIRCIVRINMVDVQAASGSTRQC
ncbi:hypothetical protein BDR03DRAFT_946565 [Suillus americanus]|nr:hypothetical protein BDR03DRAFT_946565 [Suillus americanus]